MFGIALVAANLLSASALAAEDAAVRPAPGPRSAGGGGGNSLASARDWQAKYTKDGQPAHLEAAWTALCTVLSDPDGTTKEIDDAVRLAPEIILRLRIDVVKPWLVACIATHPDRGLALVEALGEVLNKSTGGGTNDTDRRAKLLNLRFATLNTFLGQATESSRRIPQKLLIACATTWMREAEAARNDATAAQQASRPGRMTQEATRPGRPTQQPAANSISVYDLTDAAPSDRFIAALSDTEFRGRVTQSLVRTYLVENEEAAAFDRIEQLAATDDATASSLIGEFLQSWVRNHNPNPYAGNPNALQGVSLPGGQPGFRRAVVPATRSVQDLNVADLARWVARIRNLPVRQPDESLLVQAFISCHASNAIFTPAALQAVFGPTHKLQPESLRTVAEQLRANVNALRSQLAQQKSAGNPEDLRAAVVAGYAATRSLLDDSLASRPDDWRLALTRAVVTFDELDFDHDYKATADFTARRAAVMAEFARVAGLYANQIDDRTDTPPNLAVFEQWFAAALGATDLSGLTEAKVPDPRQPAKIRAAMLALPGESGERHVAAFAASLYPRIAAVKPAMKPRYLMMGAEVVSNHPRLGPAKKLLNYYQDLSKEIKLDVALDGPTAVGAMQPFGVFVQLRHTKELEQGSGGFGRFLQNQIGNQVVFAGGTPPANYRDRFESAMTAALGEHFDVMSCTFETDKVVSRPAPGDGWRVTPYAYLLLKARGPQVDRLPPLQLDLDFLDVAGYVVIPVESPAVPIDASRREPRPAERVSVTQTVDERKSSEGVLRLDVKSTARGLVPEFDQLLAPIPSNFEVVKADARPLSVVKFDPDGPTLAIQSERIWLLTLRAVPDSTDSHFRFPAAAGPNIDVKYQRYQDADVVPADAVIEVGAIHAPASRYRGYIPAACGALPALVGVVLLVRRRGRKATAEGPVMLKPPQRLTPVTVLGYLRTVAEVGRVPDEQRAEVRQTIGKLEEYYFSGRPGGSPPPELEAIVGRWAAVRA